jgi:hypothetical protein
VRPWPGYTMFLFVCPFTAMLMCPSASFVRFRWRQFLAGFRGSSLWFCNSCLGEGEVRLETWSWPFAECRRIPVVEAMNCLDFSGAFVG